ncbi:MAG: CoA-binding protein [Acidimicrobiales bacterium]
MTNESDNTVSQTAVDDFLTGHRIAVVGASNDPKNFAHTIYVEMKERHYDVVAVHPFDSVVDGDAAYPDLASVPGDLDGVVVMVPPAASAEVAQQAIDRGVRRIWLFRGLGGPGAVSEEALRRCRDHGVSVVAGACPMMFLEPVGFGHRIHRAARRHNGSLEVR